MTTYKTKQGQTWDQIAKKVYGNELMADVLMQANLKYLDLFVFGDGITIHVPEIDGNQADMPPWRKKHE